MGGGSKKFKDSPAFVPWRPFVWPHFVNEPISENDIICGVVSHAHCRFFCSLPRLRTDAKSSVAATQRICVDDMDRVGCMLCDGIYMLSAHAENCSAGSDTVNFRAHGMADIVQDLY